MALGYAVPLRNSMLTEIVTLAGTNAVIEIYEGTRPATGGTEGTLLATLTGNATQFGTVSAGVLTVSAITADSSADASGTAQWGRVYASNGTTHVFDFGVGQGSGDVDFDDNTFEAGGNVSISSWTITEGNP